MEVRLIAAFVDQRIEETVEEPDRLDQYEQSVEKAALVAQTQDAMEVLKARKANYTALRQQLPEREETQISLTDPTPER